METLLLWVFARFFKYRDIIKEENGKPVLYLRRYFIFRGKNFRIFLHRIRRSDDDRCLHDHPWDFTTFLLTGEYLEVLPDRVMRRPWLSRLVNKAEHTHRLILSRPLWTLVFAGKARRVWGFHTETGWLPWRTYLGLPESTPDSPEDLV
jgi:hypothetical protein